MTCPAALLFPASGLFVLYGEVQDVGPGVVPNAVELHFSSGHAGHVEVGKDDGFTIPYRLGDVMAEGIYYAAAAAADDFPAAVLSRRGSLATQDTCRG